MRERTESQLRGAITADIDSLPAKILLIRVSAREWISVWAPRNSAGEKMKTILRDRLRFFSERVFIIQAL